MVKKLLENLINYHFKKLLLITYSKRKMFIRNKKIKNIKNFFSSTITLGQSSMQSFLKIRPFLKSKFGKNLIEL